MDFSINRTKLVNVMKRRGYSTFEELAAVAYQRGTPLSARNLYKLAAGANYTRQTLEILCGILECSPSDLVDGWFARSNGHTHVAPQPEKELGAIAA